ncbi:ricin-type beta-trefoil lectin domain protein [Streptomyces phaeolivaceus]|uniref:Ricin-type beta-trefoil lectin domain protein n=1 Tax=Streptomyces phaeolivaceus TaxID=2653200 RepID=A0A5P8KFT8_9ACTN|nr:ricin-type beta-trefoil lectin domain protein [Streptomyces phaeolivaceus]QFR02204.1 ricin-type beta-trefoil lectin domain protein [Streptomyces phaeolivaceus]
MKGLTARFAIACAAAPLVALAAGVPASAGSGAPVDAAAASGRVINGDGDTSGTCLEITDTGRGSAVVMARCHVNAHQGWDLVPVGSGYFTMRSHDADAAGKCLTGFGEGVQVEMRSCNGQRTQQWFILYHANGWFQLQNRAQSSQCLDVRSNGLSNVVQTWLCGPANKGNQLWHWHTVS